jgi:phosphoglycolate phosphatase
VSHLGTLIFDMDGTLVDSMGLHADAFSQILYEHYAIPHATAKQEYINTAGWPLDDQFNHVLRMVGKPQRSDAQPFVDRFTLLLADAQPPLFRDVPAAIEQLAGAGYLLAITSGAPSAVVSARMHHLGLEQHFKVMLGTDKTVPDMIKGAGHFRIIRHALNLAVHEFQSNAAIIGDAQHDMMVGKQAGILAIGRATGTDAEVLRQAGADLVIADLAEFVAVLQDRSTNPPIFRPISRISRPVSEP